MECGDKRGKRALKDPHHKHRAVCQLKADGDAGKARPCWKVKRKMLL